MFYSARAIPLLITALVTIVIPVLPLPAAAAESGSASFKNTRSAVNAGAGRKTSASYRVDGSAGELGKSTFTSASYLSRDGAQVAYHYPSRITDLFASSAAASTQIYLQWTSPANDGNTELSTPGGYEVRYSSIASESPAISEAKFNAATAITPAPPAAAVRGSRLSLNVTGLRSGVTYYFAAKCEERDGTRSYLMAGATAQTTAPLGCVVVRNVHKVDGPYTTIQAAVNALPASLNGHTCVIVRDVATYAEQVTVQNFTMNGSTLSIFTDPALGGRAVVAPNTGASTGAFVIANASVNIMGFDIRPTAAVNWGVRVSSAYVTLSSVNVQNPAGTIRFAGVELSSWNTVGYSSVTVAAAHGFYLNGASMTAVSYSSAIAVSNNAGFNALHVVASSSNTFTRLHLTNTLGDGAFLGAGAAYNTITQSTMLYSGDASYQYAALYLSGASSNTVTQSVVNHASFGNAGSIYILDLVNSWYNAFTRVSAANDQGGGVHLLKSNFNTFSQSDMAFIWSEPSLYMVGSASNTFSQVRIDYDGFPNGVSLNAASNGNLFTQSTVTATGGSGVAFYINGSSTNTIAGSSIRSGASDALSISAGSDGTTVSQSTVVSSAGGGRAVLLSGPAGTSISDSYLESASGYGLYLSGADRGVVTRTTVTVNNAGFQAVYLTASDSNTITNVVAANRSGAAAIIQSGSDFNSVARSSFVAASAGAGFSLVSSDSNTVASSFFQNLGAGTALALSAQADYNRVSGSTVSAIGASGFAVQVNASSGTVLYGDLLSGATAVAVQGSTATYALSSVLIATNTAGSALALMSGGVDLYVASSALVAPSLGRGLYLDPGNRGLAWVSSVTVTGARYGVFVATQSSPFSLAVDSITFYGLTAGATAVNFGGGVFVATFNAAGFLDSTIGANVSGSSLATTSRITMNGFYGSRSGPTFENDANSLVDWQGYAPYPGCVAVSNVGAGQLYATIQAGVNALPTSLPGHSCVVIRDSGVYAEQVTVQNFTTNGSSISIFGSSPTGARPVVAPLATSTAAFRIVNSSVNIIGIDIRPGGDLAYGIYASSAYVQVSSVSVSTVAGSGQPRIWWAGVAVSSWSTVSNSSVSVGDAYGYVLTTGTIRTIIVLSSASVASPGKSAIGFVNASSNTVTASAFSNALGDGMDLEKASRFNVVSFTTATSLGSGLYTGVWVLDSDTNTFSRVYAYNPNGWGVVAQNSDYFAVANSTFIGGGNSSHSGLNLDSGSDWAVVSVSLLSDPVSSGVEISGGSAWNLIANSTITSQSGGDTALYINASSSNTVSGSVMSNTQASAVYIYQGSANRITGSRMTGGSFDRTFNADSTVGGSLEDSFATNAGGVDAGWVSGSRQFTIARTTFTANTSANQALLVVNSSGTWLDRVYAESFRGAWVQGSSNTTVTASFMQSLDSNGSALLFTNGVSNVRVTSSTLRGGAISRGVYVDAYTGNRPQGAILISSNVINGSERGVEVGAMAANGSVWVDSNTISMPFDSTNDSYGVLLYDLASGATVQNNAVAWRSQGTTGGLTTHAFFIQKSSGVLVQRNRVSNGVQTGGSFTAVAVNDGHRVELEYNDVFSTGTAFTDARLVRVYNGSNDVSLRGNVLFSSFVVSNASSTVDVAANSQTGFVSNYNDYFSSNSALGFWYGGNLTGLPAWRAASGQDANSFSSDPQWFNPAVGAEDFHPRSTGGRWNPATSAFVADGTDSPTIDQGHPSDPFVSEPAPNGSRANQGSYSGTGEASKSIAPYAGCVVTSYVHKNNGPFTSIQDGVDALPTSLTGHSCVVIKDGATYGEQVTLQGFTMNGSSISVFADPASGLRPVVVPPATSTAAFRIVNASINVTGLDVNVQAAVPFGITASSSFVNISSVNVSSAGYTAGIRLKSWSTLTLSSVTAYGAGHAFWLDQGSRTAVSISSFQTRGGGHALYVDQSSSSTFTNIMATATGAGFALNSANNIEIYNSSAVTNAITYGALYVLGGSSSTAESSYFGNYGAFITGYASVISATNRFTLRNSTSVATNSWAVYMAAADSDTITGCVLRGAPGSIGGGGVNLSGGSDYNLITLSTITAVTNTNIGVDFNGGRGNTLSNSYVSNTGQSAIRFVSNALNNTVTGVQVYDAATTASAVLFSGSSSNTVTGSRVVSTGYHAVELNGGGLNVVANSTVTSLATAANRYAVAVLTASSATIVDSYVQGSTAVFVLGSTGTVIGHVALVSTNSLGTALAAFGSVNLSLSSSTLAATSGGAFGVYLLGDAGLLILSTNTVAGGASTVYVGTQTAGTQVWLTSNTVLISTASSNVYGVQLNGLMTGATVQNNDIFARTGGALGNAYATGLYAQSSDGLLIDHNRINDPGMVYGNASFTGISLADADDVSVTYNDVHSSGTSLGAGYLLLLNNGSINVKVRNNVFASSYTALVGTFTVAVADAGSQTGFVSDYNLYYSSVSGGALQFSWGGTNYNGLAAWQSASGKDANSINALPRWADTKAGSEDFHPLSANGRYLDGSFINDAATAQSIDAGDPADPYGNETANNGGRVNLGSYGNTDQASRSQLLLCPTQRTVCISGLCDQTSVGAAVASLPTTLTGYACVVIRDGATYAEGVELRNFVNNGSSITVMADPGSGLRPVIAPPSASTAAFFVANASVNIVGLDIRPTASVQYGVYASSSYVNVSSVNVDAPGGFIWNTAVIVSSLNTVSNSSVTVGGTFGRALWVTGSSNTVVMSSFTSYGFQTIRLSSAVSNVFDVVFASGGVSNALNMHNSSGNRFSRMKVANYAASNFPAIYMWASSSNSFSFVASSASNAHALDVYQSHSNVFSTSSFFSTGTVASTVYVDDSRYTLFDNVVSSAVNTTALDMENGVQLTVVRNSSFSAMGSWDAVYVFNSASNTFTNNVVRAHRGSAIDLDSGAHLNSFSRLTALNNGSGGAAVFFTLNADSNTVADSFIRGIGAGSGFDLELGRANQVVRSTAIGGPGYSAYYNWHSTQSTVTDSYLEGERAVMVEGSTGTVVRRNTLIGDWSVGYAIGALFQKGSRDVTLADNRFDHADEGVWIEETGGAVTVASNTIAGQWDDGIAIATMSYAGSVYVDSNTVVVNPQGSDYLAGISFYGPLASGATVQYNSVVARTRGGTANQDYPLFFARSTSKLVVKRNRFSNPGMFNTGNVYGAGFRGVTQSQFEYNDVHSTGTGLTNAFLVAMEGSTVAIRGNIFSSSYTVTGSSGSLLADAASNPDSDYNLWFSSTGRNSLVWGASSFAFPWTQAGKDVNSRSGNPYFNDPRAGVEDFHPKALAGRWNPGTSAFVNDALDSISIDGANPADPFASETSPNGSRANLGSYGNTPEASRSTPASYAGCVAVSLVGAGQPYATIQGGVNALPASLTGHSCVVVKDAATYAEQVTVQNFTMNGSSISIFTDPAVGARALVAPNTAVSTAAFRIANASVNVYGIDVRPAASVQYGVWASSAYVRVSSMNVDAPAFVWGAGVRVSSRSAVSYSSVTVGNAHGVWLDGSTMTVISFSSAVNNSSSGRAVYFQAASSNSFLVSLASNTAGYALELNPAAHYNLVSQSTVTSNALGFAAMYIQASSSNSIVNSYINSPRGKALEVFLADYNNIALSTMSSNRSGGYGFTIRGVGNAVTGSVAVNPLGDAGELFIADWTLIADSTMTSNSSSAQALQIISGSSNTVARSYVRNGAGAALVLDTAYYTSVYDSTASAGGAGWWAFYFNNGASNTVTRSLLASSAGPAVWADGGANYSSVYDSVLTANDSGSAALHLGPNAPDNSFARLMVSNGSGNGVRLSTNADRNSLTQSTVTAFGASAIGLAVTSASSNSVVGCYVQGSTAAWVSLSTGTQLRGSVFVATNTAGTAVSFAGGVNLTVTSTTLVAPSLGRGLALDTGSVGTVSVGSVTVLGALRGVEVSTQATGFALAVDSISFSGLASGATAIHFLGGTFVSTINAAQFADASIGANVSGAALDPLSRVTMRGFYGARSGPTYENDPNGVVDWNEPNFAGCVVTRNVGAGYNYSTIQAGVNALPATLGGHSCVVVRDLATYAEQVTVQNFTMNGSSISIFTDPGLGAQAVVAPAGGTAGFRIINSSVNVMRVDIRPSGSVSYGVFASSAYVRLSSVNVQSANGLVSVAGVALSSQSSISYSSVTVTDAIAYSLQYATFTAIAFSSGANNSATRHALSIVGGSSHTVSDTFLNNASFNGRAASANLSNDNTFTRMTAKGGWYGLILDNADRNVVRASSLTGTGIYGAYLYAADSNTITQSALQGWGGANFEQANANLVSGSTFSASSAYGLYNTDSDSNTFTGSMFNGGQYGLWIEYNSVNNTVSYDTMTARTNYGLYFSDLADSNTVTYSYIQGADSGLYIDNSHRNVVSRSSITGTSTYHGVGLWSATSNTVTASWIYGALAGVGFENNSRYNSISVSTVSGGQNGVMLGLGSLGNDIRQSTITSSAAGYAALWADHASSNTIYGSYVAGSTAVYVSGSTGIVIGGSVLVATNTAGAAVAFADGAVNLTLASSTLISPALGRGLVLSTGNAGVVAVGSVTFTGSLRGLEVSTQTANFTLAVDSVNFRSLAAGATAVHFLGGTFVTTITAAGFEDASVGANVSGAALALASRVTMRGFSGARGGDSYENDPNGLVDWAGLAPYPGCVVVRNVGSGEAYPTISAGVAALPASLPGHACVVVRDGATYAEQVTVQNFTNNGSSISIFAVPGLRPVVDPPTGSTAAFVVRNASVNVSGFDITPTVEPVAFGVYASSQGVRLSSLSVTGGASLWLAGVRLGSWESLDRSTVSVLDAAAVFLEGSSATLVNASSMTSRSVLSAALRLEGASTNTVSGSFVENAYSTAASMTGGWGNRIEYSTLSAVSGYGLFGAGASSASLRGLVVTATSSSAGYFDATSHWMTVMDSVFVSSGNGMAFETYGSSYAFVNDFFHGRSINSAGMYFESTGAHWIHRSTFTGMNWAALSFYDGGAVYNDGVHISSSYFEADGTGSAVEMSVQGRFSITGSTFVSRRGQAGDLGADRGFTIDYSLFKGWNWANSFYNYYNNAPTATVYRSTFMTLGGTGGAVDTWSSTKDLWFIESYIECSGGADANCVNTNATGTSLIRSTVASNNLRAGMRVDIDGRVTDSWVLTTSTRAYAVENSYSNSGDVRITGSTLTARGLAGLRVASGATGFASGSYIQGALYGAWYDRASSFTIVDSYVQGSTAVYVHGSTGVVIGGSVLVTTSAYGAALHLSTGTSNNVSVSSSALRAGEYGMGVQADAGGRGALQLSSNTISGGFIGVFIGTRPYGDGVVHLASNTVVVSTSASRDTFGLLFDGLQSGATVESNTVVQRAVGAMSGLTLRGVALRSSRGVVLLRNRLSAPGRVTAGSVEVVRFDDADAVRFAFNDVHSTGTSLTDAYLLRAVNGSTGLVLADNVFFSSFAVSGASATASFDAASALGSADYNDYVSSNSLLSFVYAGAPAQGLAGWRTATGFETNSISADPQWYDAGSEDFHPRSVAGRYNPASASFVNDGTTAATIDAGDPSEAFSNETSPNGARANQGSYGNTGEASRTGNTNYPGCVVTANVGAGQTYGTISAGVNALPSSLTGHSCVVVRDAATYAEQVTVQNFTMNGSSISIFTDPGVGARATVSPSLGTSTAAFHILNSSINVTGLNVVVSQNIPYGIYASSAYVNISSVSVSTGSNTAGILTAGVSLSSWSTLSYSSVALHGSDAVRLAYSSKTAISYSTITNNSSTRYALYMVGATSNSVSNSFIYNHDYVGVFLDVGANANTLLQSTAQARGWTPSGYGLYMVNASSNVIDRSYIRSQFRNGLVLQSGAGNVITRSTASNPTASFSALSLQGSSNTFTAGFIDGFFDLGGSYNTISLSSVTGPAAQIVGQMVGPGGTNNRIDRSFLSSDFGLSYSGVGPAYITNSTVTARVAAAKGITVTGSSLTVSGSYISGSTAVVVSNATGTVISASVLVGTNTTGAALAFQGASVNLTVTSSTLISQSQGSGLYFGFLNMGAVNIGSVTVTGAARGVVFSTQSGSFALAVDSITFAGLAPGATAVHFLGGSFVSTFNAANFADTTVGANVSGAALDLTSRITMNGHYGVRTSPTYENDPNALVDWAGYAGYAGCSFVANVGAGQPYATIQAGVNAVPSSLAGHACVVVRDAATYAEQVTVQNFTMNGSSLSIFTDPSVGSRAVIDPPATSTAAFFVKNASVNVYGFDIRPTVESVTYGVYSSSSFVRLSSITVAAGGKVTDSAVGLIGANWNTVSYTSVTVDAGATGFTVNASSGNVIAYSTAIGYLAEGINVVNSSSNVFHALYSTSTWNGMILNSGSNWNFISSSTIYGANTEGLDISGASNTVSASNIDAVVSVIDGPNNKVFNSTYSSFGSFNDALYVDAPGTLISGSVFRSVTNAAGLDLSAQASYTTILNSSMTSAANYEGALAIAGASVTVSGVYASNSAFAALRVTAAGGYVTVTGSTFAATGAVPAFVNTASDGFYGGSVFLAPASSAVYIAAGSARNTIWASTLSASGAGLFVHSAASNTVLNSYVQGSTAAFVDLSTSTAFRGTTLASTGGSGAALALSSGNVGVTLTTSTLLGPVSGRGLAVTGANTGALAVSSVTVLRAARGIELSTQAAGFSLAIDSVTFGGLSAGATAIHFLGGDFVSTITAAQFPASVAVNVNGSPLSLASRVTMRGSSGLLMGPSFENDVNSLVDWPDLLPPSPVTLWFVGLSSAGLNYGTVGANGYTVQASTRADFQAGTTVSSTVFGTQGQLTVTPLMPNSTYYLRAGSLWGGSTVYAQTVLSTSTLANLVSGTTVYQIHLTSMVVNWVPLNLSPPDASSKTAEGYVLQASSMATFAPLWSSSATANVALSTLTIDTLRGGVTYYFRVGSLNHNGVPNFAGAVSTLMPVQLGVELTTHTISVPGLVNMNATVLITTSVVVTNTGNVKETYWVRATTMTPGSPWTIGTSQGVDRYVLSMLINPTEPVVGNFGIEDKLLDDEKDCTAAVFAFGGSCVQVPVGTSKTLWFKLDTPIVTSTGASQDIRIFVRAVRDPDPDPNP